MKSHFTLNGRIVEFTPPAVTKKNSGNHIKIGSRAALALAVSGASAMLTGVCSAQVVASDSATGSTYSGGWSAGQNGGSGFGAWSFNGTSTPGGVADPGGQQTISSSSAVGTAWTMFNLGSAPPSGISDVGRSITAGGGLQVGEQFRTVLQNPTGYHFYGGLDIMFLNGTDNNPAGNNAAIIRASIFDYYTSGGNWGINDAGGGHSTTLSKTTTAAAGMSLNLTLVSATAYSLTLTPLGNPSASYTYNGTYSGTIDYVNYRLYDGLSAGPNDTADNLEISSMSIVPEPASFGLIGGLGATGLLFLRRRK